MALYVGTSGWEYREWRAASTRQVCPRALPGVLRAQLTACEVNATFHRLHSREPCSLGGRGADSVPVRRQGPPPPHPPEAIAPPTTAAFMRDFASSLEPLGEHLACLLVQFPPFVERDDDGAGDAAATAASGLRFACEFRHESWATSDVEIALAQAGGTVCLSETEGLVPESLASASLAYVRLRGDHYADEARSGWLELLERESRTRDVYAFGKHKDVPAGDPHAGVGLAQWLVEHSSQARIGSGS